MIRLADIFDPRAAFRTPPTIGALPKVEVFVDELGDRGFSTKSSETFAMVAVLVPSESMAHMRVVISGLRAEINTTKPLHWVDHFTPKPKHDSRRHLASDLVATIPGVKVVYVIAHKRTLIASEQLKADRDLFYNYVTKLLLERVAFAARYWPGGPRMAITRLSAVKNMDHTMSLDYLVSVRRGRRTAAPMEYIKWPPEWYGPDRWDGLQLADLYLGMLNCALTGDDHDEGCATHLLKHRHQIRRGPRGQILGWGVKVYGDDAFLLRRCWWKTVSR